MTPEGQLEPTALEYWTHRARIAESELAGRQPFWLSRGRLKARNHTWIYPEDQGTEPGIALLDEQGRLRGHLTDRQARRLIQDLDRCLTQNQALSTEGTQP